MLSNSQILLSLAAIIKKFKVLIIPVTCVTSCIFPWHYFISIFFFQIKAYIHIIQVNFQHARNAYCFPIRAKFNLIFYWCAFATYCADTKLHKSSLAFLVCFWVIGLLLAFFILNVSVLKLEQYCNTILALLAFILGRAMVGKL